MGLPRVASRKGVKGPTVSFECDGPATSAGWIRLPPRRRPERARDSDPDEALQHARLGLCWGSSASSFLRTGARGDPAGLGRRFAIECNRPAGWGEDLQLIAIDRSSDSSTGQDQPGRKHSPAWGQVRALQPKPAVPDEGEAHPDQRAATEWQAMVRSIDRIEASRGFFRRFRYRVQLIAKKGCPSVSLRAKRTCQSQGFSAINCKMRCPI